MKLSQINRVYFIGIGGIGMSALARYFNALKKPVGGYDKVSKPLTQQLEKEGMIIHYKDEPTLIPSPFTENKKNTLVIYTPAIPNNHKELNYFKEKGYTIKKRSEVLGILSKELKCIGIAGTHGKTSISTLTAHIFNNSSLGCNAFLGGISKNYDNNIIINPKSKYLIAEADEFDRSFLQLNPELALITSIDEDHLDIYNDQKTLNEAFSEFAGKITKNGTLIKHKDVSLIMPENKKINQYTYSLNGPSDFYAENIRTKEGKYWFDLVTPEEKYTNIPFALPGSLNIENAIAALSIAFVYGIDKTTMINSLKNFSGIERRFDIQVNNKNLIYIDDYAHHPSEISYTIQSLREMYPNKKILGVFQPHLYSRTQHLAKEFAKSLELLDETIILDIYPAREEPIEGVSSEIIKKQIKNIPATLSSKEKLIDLINKKEFDILITMGAGDIDQLVEPIKRNFTGNSEE
ncbi:MAG: UDP-N-acetylmuramate--L-alanine ligase [Bacteroidota bacterium]